MRTEAPSCAWAEDVFRIVRQQRIQQIATVPDAGLTALLRRCECADEINVVTLTTEEEGIALACGAWMGGQRAALFMQSSGVGNCVNMLALPQVCHIPCLMLVTMRGEWREFNPWQVPMGLGAPDVLQAMGVTLFRPEGPADVGSAFERAAHLAFSEGAAAAVLVSQQIVGVKDFEKPAMEKRHSDVGP